MSALLPSTLGIHTNAKDNIVAKKAEELGTQLLHPYFADHGYKTMPVGKIFHRHVPKESVDMARGRLEFNHGTVNLKANWPQKGTSTDWAMAPESDKVLGDYEAAT